ncbi:MAG: YifB family Mg chelatase-like AAA ATPase [Lachnospiraceae bacterium]|nr:YifB family Mg chelatase-like AAA ATPase [Lachnospiraceae bacterium]
MYAKINAMCIRGIDGIPITVEADVSNGLPEYSMVGALSSEVREAKERVRTALRNTDFVFPPKRITVNLSPADIHKEGTAFDLAIAIGIAAAHGAVKPPADNAVLLGELGLDGSVCPVSGVLPMVLAAKKNGFRTAVVPFENASEAAMVDGIVIIPVKSLRDAMDYLDNPVRESFSAPKASGGVVYDVDFSEINGQPTMRRAAEIAACGMHNILFIGTPGSGKTMIARRIPTILPELTWEEALEVTRVYSVRGLTSSDEPIITARPFRAPHHTVSAAALIGGGKMPRPGEISLADRGVLFLDELPEFPKNVLESLRQPLEDREVLVARAGGACRFPANIMLCAAMNPCRCGYYPDRTKCSCTESDVKRYLGRISGPMLDRIDVCVQAPPVKYRDLGSAASGESSITLRRRVEKAWEIQRERFKNSKNCLFNSQMKNAGVKKYCALQPADGELMEKAFDSLNLSARAYHKVLKVARTIADMDGSENIKREHLLEALSFREKDIGSLNS